MSETKITMFLDNEGKIKIWPSKSEKKQAILEYLAEKFETGRIYNEKEVNCIISSWHTFNDYFLLRRGLVDYRFMSRTTNGAKYWKEEYQNTNTEENVQENHTAY